MSQIKINNYVLCILTIYKYSKGKVGLFNCISHVKRIITFVSTGSDFSFFKINVYLYIVMNKNRIGKQKAMIHLMCSFILYRYGSISMVCYRRKEEKKNCNINNHFIILKASFSCYNKYLKWIVFLGVKNPFHFEVLQIIQQYKNLHLVNSISSHQFTQYFFFIS